VSPNSNRAGGVTRGIISGSSDPKAYSHLLVAVDMLREVMGGILESEKLGRR